MAKQVHGSQSADGAADQKSLKSVATRILER